jgi:hypothetical protein
MRHIAKIRRSLVAVLVVLFAGSGVRAQDGILGLGVMIGEPTGISAKLMAGRGNAFSGGAAWSIASDVFYFQVDYLRYFYDVFPVPEGALPLYAGVGGGATLKDDPVLGPRVPLGLAYFLEETPVEVFAEVAPRVIVVPDTDFDVQGVVGVRFLFWETD